MKNPLDWRRVVRKGDDARYWQWRRVRQMIKGCRITIKIYETNIQTLTFNCNAIRIAAESAVVTCKT